MRVFSQVTWISLELNKECPSSTGCLNEADFRKKVALFFFFQRNRSQLRYHSLVALSVRCQIKSELVVEHSSNCQSLSVCGRWVRVQWRWAGWERACRQHGFWTSSCSAVLEVHVGPTVPNEVISSSILKCSQYIAEGRITSSFDFPVLQSEAGNVRMQILEFQALQLLNTKHRLSSSEDCRACSNYKFIGVHFKKCLKSLKSVVKVKIFSVRESNTSIRL